MIDLSIVIVEDEVLLLNTLEKYLKMHIKNVYAFENAVELLDNIEKINPDIIISDIYMPNMSGIDMYKELKSRGIKTPIIFATAQSDSNLFIEAIKLKAKNFIVKPFNMKELILELEEFEEELSLKKELKQKEEMFRIQSKLAALGEMLGNISHQWKQPLNAISSSIVNLQMRNELDKFSDVKKIDKALIKMEESVKYMNDTMRDFQNYLKPNNIPKEFFIEDTINKVESLVSLQISESDIKFKKDIKNFKINNFQNDLIQVLINIQTNAIDELKKKDDEKILMVKSFEKENKHFLVIQDNAGGIPKDIEDKIFDPFFTTKDDAGTGIGLYMSKQITEKRLHSKIDVLNEEFKFNDKIYYGAKFSIELNAF